MSVYEECYNFTSTTLLSAFLSRGAVRINLLFQCWQNMKQLIHDITHVMYFPSAALAKLAILLFSDSNMAEFTIFFV